MSGVVSTAPRLTGVTRLTAAEAYCNGYAAGTDGVNDTNCHFANFATPELRDAWHRGNHDAKDGRPCTP